MKKSDLIKIIKEEIRNTLKELYMLDDPIEAGAHQNLQTRLKDGDPDEIAKAVQFVKDVGTGQGAAAAAVLGVLGVPAAALPTQYAVERAAVNAATRAFRAIPSATARKSLHIAAVEAWKARKLGTNSEAFRQFLYQTSKHAFPK